MTVTRTIKSFHEEVNRLVKNEVRKRDAWERVEKKYFELTGKNRYKNYKSFRQVNWQITTGNYRHFK